MIDGRENLDAGSNSVLESYPAMAVIQEYRVMTNNYSPAYPSAAGAALALAIDPYYPPQIEQYSLGVQR